MGSKFLVFVMLYVMVDVSLVLGFSHGVFHITRPGPNDTTIQIECRWRNGHAQYNDELFKVIFNLLMVVSDFLR